MTVELFFKTGRSWAHSILLIAFLWTTVLAAPFLQAHEQCVQVYRPANTSRPSTIRVEDIEPLSFEELDGYHVYSVHLKNGQRKVIRFANPITVRFEDFASRFFHRFSTIQTSEVTTFTTQDTLRLLDMLQKSDPDAVETILLYAPHKIPQASAVDFQEGVRGMDELAARGLDWSRLSRAKDSTRLSDELALQTPSLIPASLRVQLADYWATATVLQILDPHSKNWLYQDGRVIAIDLAYPTNRRDLHRQATTPLKFKYATGPFSFAELTDQMRAHLIENISPNLLDHFQKIDARSIEEMAAQSGLTLRPAQVQRILERVREILRLRQQLA